MVLRPFLGVMSRRVQVGSRGQIRRDLTPLLAGNAEAVAATDITGRAGDAHDDAAALVVDVGNELYLMLGGLIR